MKSSNWLSVRIIRDVLNGVSLSSQQVSAGGNSTLSLFKGAVISYGEERVTKWEAGLSQVLPLRNGGR